MARVANKPESYECMISFWDTIVQESNEDEMSVQSKIFISSQRSAWNSVQH